MNEKNVQPENGAAGFPLETVVMPKISGVVRYRFSVECPLCGKGLDLNQWPYDDEQEDYGPAEDELGLALFGRRNEPAKWEGIEIEYKCYGCKKHFLLTEIEI